MGDLGATAYNLFQVILIPARAGMEAIGLQPSDMQVWALMVAVFMLALALPGSYGDWILTRRQARTTGSVVSIDRSGDTDTPRIGFRDRSGEHVEFDSTLPVNAATDAVGNGVEIVYDPLHPSRAREAGRHIAKGFGIIVWYGVALAIFVYAIWGGALPVG